MEVRKKQPIDIGVGPNATQILSFLAKINKLKV